MRKIKVIKLDTDNMADIIRFRELWSELKPEIEEVFVPKNVKFLGSSDVTQDVTHKIKGDGK